MPTIALEGTGAQIAFSTTGLTADLISLSLPDRAKDAIGSSHLGSLLTQGNRGGKLVDPGQVVVEFDHVPNAPALLRRPSEQVTISYPLQPGDSSPAKLVFTAFATAEGGGELTAGNRMTRQVTLALTSDLAFQPAGPPITNASVSPIVEGVTANGNGTWTALWGWNNRNTVPVTIPIGVNNRFSPGPQARGQPVVFLPGRRYGQFSTIITATLVWFLRGPDGSGRTATAGAR
jgi:hypothetical protein